MNDDYGGGSLTALPVIETQVRSHPLIVLLGNVVARQRVVINTCYYIGWRCVGVYSNKRDLHY